MGKHTVYRQRLRSRVLDQYGGKCAKCEYSDRRALELDHVASGGKAHRRQCNSRELWLLEALHCPSTYQLLCANCNRIKQWEQREWPVPPNRLSP
jgi:hypothetical protein